MQVKTNLEGEHNGVKFVLYDGFLQILGAKLTKSQIQTIVEVSTLLTLQGYAIREKERRIKYMPSMFGQMAGESVEYYEDDEKDGNK